MTAQTSIEWTDVTWNPVTGCTKVSQGCKNCYAERMAKRLQSMGLPQYEHGFQLRLAEHALTAPLDWGQTREPSSVNSMSDLFHEGVPLSYIQEVFAVMSMTPQHTYQILTKRSQRLRVVAKHLPWPENVWMGVSVENQRAVPRVRDLSSTGAAIKFLSVEPLLEYMPTLPLTSVDWVIVGGESGPKARPLRPQWVHSIREQCRAEGIPFFFKQWGRPAFNPDPTDPTIAKDHPHHAKGGCQLSGKVYRAMPSRRLTSA